MILETYFLNQNLFDIPENYNFATAKKINNWGALT